MTPHRPNCLSQRDRGGRHADLSSEYPRQEPDIFAGPTAQPRVLVRAVIPGPIVILVRIPLLWRPWNG
jgi:hypothetical protein